jgi:hypothetical protein
MNDEVISPAPDDRYREFSREVPTEHEGVDVVCGSCVQELPEADVGTV